MALLSGLYNSNGTSANGSFAVVDSATVELESTPTTESTPASAVEPVRDEPQRRPRAAVDSPANPFDALREWVEQIARSGVDEARVTEIVRAHLASVPPARIEVAIGDRLNRVEGRTHYQFELALRAINSGVNLALTGPAATGKTSLAIQAAQALGKEYLVFKPVVSAHELTGYTDAHGNYVESNLYRAHKRGAVAIFDEFDASDSQAALVLNSVLENKCFTYPNGETVTNPEFQAIITMNTRGVGADRMYVGRNRLDAATIDRYAVLEIEHDDSLEAALGGVVEPQRELRIKHGGIPSPDEYLKLVREKRSEYRSTHPDKLVSMRAYRDGLKLLRAGIGITWVTKMVIDK
jgi:cobaltochelatase CobS